MKVILYGAGGRMGKEILSLIETSEKATLAAAVDKISASVELSELSEFCGEADVIIDFSNPSSLDALLSYCKRNKMPIVICTTGHSTEQLEAIKAASAEIPVFRSGNMPGTDAYNAQILADYMPRVRHL